MVAGCQRGPTGDWTPCYAPLPSAHPSPFTRRVKGPVQSQSSSMTRACDPSSLASVTLAGLILKQYRSGRVRSHWRPRREDRSLLPHPSKRALHCAAALLHPITLCTGHLSCLLSIYADTLHSCRAGQMSTCRNPYYWNRQQLTAL